MTTQDNHLSHHGILGQKWGRRRYQNPDGSLTPEGRRRAQQLKGEYKSLTGKKLKGKIPKEDPNGKRVKDLNDTELSNRIKRLQNEKTALGLEKDLSSNGQKFMRSVGKDVLAPAAIDAGKRLMSKLFYDTGAKALGLDKPEMQDSLKILERQMKEAEYKNRKHKAETDLQGRIEREKQKTANSLTISDNKDNINKGSTWYEEMFPDLVDRKK